MGCEMAADRRAEAEHGAVDDFLPVDGVGNGLAHPDIAERLAAQVDAHHRLSLGGPDHHLEAVVVLEPGQGFRRTHIGDRVHVAGQQRRYLGGGIGDEAEGDAIQLHGVRIAELGIA